MSKAPHLVLVAPYFPPKIGGMENYAHKVASEFAKSGVYKVSVVTTSHEINTYREEIIDGMRIYRLPFWFKLSNTPISLAWYFWFRKFFKKTKPDVIHLHSPVPFMADVAAYAAGGIPTILTYHSGSMLKGRILPDLFIRAYESIFLRILLRKVSAIVPVSMSFLDKKWGKKFAYKTTLIMPGVDASRFSARALPRGGKTILFVGRIELTSGWKGIAELLAAMKIVLAQCPEARLEFVGGGDAVLFYEQMARALGIWDSVEMRGPAFGDDLARAYHRAALFVLPSTSDAEQSSMALIEAMASGRPVVGTRIGGTPYIIKDGVTGLLVEPKDPEALAKALLRILNNDDLAEELARGAAAAAQEVDWSLQIEKYRELIRSVSSA